MRGWLKWACHCLQFLWSDLSLWGYLSWAWTLRPYWPAAAVRTVHHVHNMLNQWIPITRAFASLSLLIERLALFQKCSFAQHFCPFQAFFSCCFCFPQIFAPVIFSPVLSVLLRSLNLHLRGLYICIFPNTIKSVCRIWQLMCPSRQN